MLKKSLLTVLAIQLLIAGTSCSTWRKFDDTEKGAVIGGGTGALVGSAVSPGIGGAVVGGAAGALGGGLIGHEIEEGKRRRD